MLINYDKKVKLFIKSKSKVILSRTVISILILCLSVNSLLAQNNIVSEEDSLPAFFQQLKKADTDVAKENVNNKIILLLKSTLQNSNSFSYPFDSLKSLGITNAPDNSFRLFTWFYPLLNGSYKYFGFIQVKEKDTIKLFDLVEKPESMENSDEKVLNPQQWPGCLYYKILKNKSDNKVYYTLFALRYNDIFTTSKIIDVLYFDEKGYPVFGAPLFKTGNKIKNRVIFKYSARVTMNLKYNDELKIIVFDHLAPSETKYSGQYEYYGPDFTFDGFEFKDNMWVYKQNIDLRRSEKSIKRAPRKSNKLR